MTSRRADTSRATRAYEIDAGNTISVTASPLLVPARQSQLDLPALSLGLSSLSRAPSYRKLHRSNSRESDSTRIDIAPEEQLSSFHYGKRQFRVPYLDSPVHKDFRTWIYVRILSDIFPFPSSTPLLPLLPSFPVPSFTELQLTIFS